MLKKRLIYLDLCFIADNILLIFLLFQLSLLVVLNMYSVCVVKNYVCKMLNSCFQSVIKNTHTHTSTDQAKKNWRRFLSSPSNRKQQSLQTPWWIYVKPQLCNLVQGHFTFAKSTDSCLACSTVDLPRFKIIFRWPEATN